MGDTICLNKKTYQTDPKNLRPMSLLLSLLLVMNIFRLEKFSFCEWFWMTVCVDSARGLDGGGVPPSGRQPADHARQGTPDLLDQTQGRLLRADRHHQAGESLGQWTVRYARRYQNISHLAYR